MASQVFIYPTQEDWASQIVFSSNKENYPPPLPLFSTLSKVEGDNYSIHVPQPSYGLVYLLAWRLEGIYDVGHKLHIDNWKFWIWSR